MGTQGAQMGPNGPKGYPKDVFCLSAFSLFVPAFFVAFPLFSIVLSLPTHCFFIALPLLVQFLFIPSHSFDNNSTIWISNGLWALGYSLNISFISLIIVIPCEQIIIWIELTMFGAPNCVKDDVIKWCMLPQMVLKQRFRLLGFCWPQIWHHLD